MANDVLLGRWNEMVVFLGHTSLPFFKIVLRSHVFHYEREELSTWGKPAATNKHMNGLHG
jgi:hypothetical protein